MDSQTKYATYRTKGGERWDTLSEWAYGNSYLSDEIIKANPGITISGRLEQGITIYMPILERGDGQSLPKELLPPWLR